LGKASAAPRMKIIPSTNWQEDAAYCVTRDNFMGSEQHIVEVLQAHGVEVLVESELH
jgi:hypothetical protein